MVRSTRRPSSPLRHIQAGFSFIEILVVMGIISVLVSMVVVVVPFIREKGKRTKSTDNVRTMILYYTGSGAGLEHSWPGYNGKDFVLWLVATNKVSKDDDKSLEILFSPGDENYTFGKAIAGGRGIYKDLNKVALGTGNQNHLQLTSYAGRRNRDREHILSSAEQQKNGIILCDDDDGDLHHKDGLVCGYVGGAARFVEWDTLDMPKPDEKHPEGLLGDNSPHPELKHMSSGN